MNSDFRSDDSFLVKIGGRATEMAGHSFDAEYPSYSTGVVVSDLLLLNFRFYWQKPAENRKLMKLVVTMLK